MLKALSLTVALAIAGDGVAAALQLPVPGPVFGMVALTALLCFRADAGVPVAALFDRAAPVFPLFFIPAAVGAVASLETLSREWLSLAAAIAGSTSIALVGAGVVAERLLRPRTREEAA